MIDQNAFAVTGIVDSGRDVSEKYDITIRLEALGAFKTAPGVFNILLPRKISTAGIDEFQTKFPTCSFYTGSTYWYYFRSSGCVDASATDIVQGVDFTTALTSNNTVGKFPEYQRIVDDGIIEVTYVFGNEGEVGGSDVEAALASKLGEGVAISEDLFEEGVRRSKDYLSGNLVVRVHYFGLKGHFADLSAETSKVFSRYAGGSDVIFYNGHAGLGRNVDALTESLTFVSGQYYFLFINACQPYAYIDPELFRKSERANPGDLWSKNLDVGSNVRIGSFNYGYDVANLISSLLKFESYLDVLTNLSISGYPAVMGEEDNPSSFLTP
jgi:hypothetical protein